MDRYFHTSLVVDLETEPRSITRSSSSNLFSCSPCLAGYWRLFPGARRSCYFKIYACAQTLLFCINPRIDTHFQPRTWWSNFSVSTSSGDEFLRIIFLLLPVLRKGSNTSEYATNHEEQWYNWPNNSPALWRTAISFGKYAGVRFIDFSKDEIVADIPDTVQGWHDPDEKLERMSASCEQFSGSIDLPRRILMVQHAWWTNMRSTARRPQRPSQ
jgi:hypothetical protein